MSLLTGKPARQQERQGSQLVRLRHVAYGRELVQVPTLAGRLARLYADGVG